MSMNNETGALLPTPTDSDIQHWYALDERAPDPALLREFIAKYPWMQTELEDLHIALTKEKYGRPADE